MRRAIALSIATLGLLAGLAAAEPQVTVTYRSGVAIIQLTGDFAGSVYTVYRAAAGNPAVFASPSKTSAMIWS